ALIAALLTSIPACDDTGSGEGAATPTTSDVSALTPAAAPAPAPGAAVPAADQAAAPAPSPRGSGPLDGLYLRVYSSGGSLNKDYYLFAPTGDFTTIPFGGVDPFDFAAAARAYPGSTGTFTLQGDKLWLQFANGKTQEMKFAVTKEGVELDDLFA